MLNSKDRYFLAGLMALHLAGTVLSDAVLAVDPGVSALGLFAMLTGWAVVFLVMGLRR